MTDPAGHVPAGTTGRVALVCVVAELVSDAGSVGVTAIDKRPVDGAVRVGPWGLYADVQADRAHHGGHDQALYLYDADEAVHWESELGRAVAPGAFGENLRVAGIAVDHLEIGARLRAGTALLEVTAPRTPCATFERWIGVAGFRARFHERGRTGAYCRVLEPGAVGADDAVEVVSTPGHGATVAAVFAGARDADLARTLRDWSAVSGVPLHAEIVARSARLLETEA
ncbi:MOSC domain-containing protein [Brachybacterium huguangmaarense]